MDIIMCGVRAGGVKRVKRVKSQSDGTAWNVSKKVVASKSTSPIIHQLNSVCRLGTPSSKTCFSALKRSELLVSHLAQSLRLPRQIFSTLLSALYLADEEDRYKGDKY